MAGQVILLCCVLADPFCNVAAPDCLPDIAMPTAIANDFDRGPARDEDELRAGPPAEDIATQASRLTPQAADSDCLGGSCRLTADRRSDDSDTACASCSAASPSVRRGLLRRIFRR